MAAPVGLALLDRDLRHVRVNEALAAMNGRSVADHLGRTVAEVVPELAPVVVPTIRRVLETGEAHFDVEVSGRTAASGTDLRHWLAGYYPVRGADGGIVGVGVVLLDISARKRAELALQESDQRFRALASNAPISIFLTDARGEITFVSPRWRAATGVPVEDALGQGWYQSVHPEDRERIVGEWSAAARSGEDYATEARFIMANGETGWFSSRGVALRDAAGKVTGYVGTLMDITEQRRGMRQLDAQRAFLRQVIDLNPSFVFAKDRAGRFTLVNQAVAENYGTTVEDLVGRTDADFNPNLDEVAHFRRDDLEVMDTKREKLIPEEVITDAAGRVRFLQTIKRAIVGPDGRANQVLGVSTDITARKRLEEQLAHAQKMEAIGRLAGGVAHDFNNLLTVILGSVDILLRALEPGHPLHSNAEDIRNAAERAAMLTRQLLAFGRKQVLQPRVLDLNRVVTESVRMLGHFMGEDVELVTALEATRPSVRADAVQITQVILNLAINARDAMPDGGRLTIRTADAMVDAVDAATRPGVAPGEYVTIAVSDTGQGIAPDVLPHLFEPFFTTKAPGHGTGLGLATSYGIVQQSGGHITLSSEMGQGTTFVVFLPRAEETAETPEPHAAEASGGDETILLVEDDPMVLGVASMSLRTKGYLVLEAANGNDAMAVAAAHRGPIHLLVTDVVMPQMGGVGLATQLARTRPETRVLYTSGYAERTAATQSALEAGVAFLPKPYVPEALARRVREVLDARGE